MADIKPTKIVNHVENHTDHPFENGAIGAIGSVAAVGVAVGAAVGVGGALPGLIVGAAIGGAAGAVGAYVVADEMEQDGKTIPPKKPSAS